MELCKYHSEAITQKVGQYGFTYIKTVGGLNAYKSSNGYIVLEEVYNNSKNVYYTVKGFKNDSNYKLDLGTELNWDIVNEKETELKNIVLSEIMKTDISLHIDFMNENKDMMIEDIECFISNGLTKLEAFIKVLKRFKRRRYGNAKGWIKILIKKGYEFKDLKSALSLIK